SRSVRGAGGVGGGSNSMSTPKIAVRSSASSTRPRAAGTIPARPNEALSSASGSTARSENSSSGAWSRRAPTPYSVAATCLHIPAQSGQEQLIVISEGEGKSPSFGLVTTLITLLDIRPSSSSTSEATSPPQA